MKQSDFFSFIILLSLTLSQDCLAQLGFVPYDSIPVVISGNTLANAWAGGLNSPKFSEIDLDGDGIKDLFAFESGWNGRVKTYINQGTPNTVDYYYAPAYQAKFPAMRNWALLADYNCDGKQDIFTSVAGGVAVYRNDYNPTDGLNFTLMTSLLYTEGMIGQASLYVGPSDIPAIVDVDNDGDLDVLAFGFFGNTVEYHKNKTIENYGTCDSLEFELQNRCWGYFFENSLNNSVTLHDTCLGNVFFPETTNLHAGSTLLALDMSGNGVKDLVLGDVSYNNMVLLTNGGTTTTSNMIAEDMAFPSNTTPINLPIFPAGFYLDVNNDGKKDLLVAPNVSNDSENFEGIWYYKNTGTAAVPVFSYQQNDFLQEQMIEVGTGANPTFFDYNADGLLDIIIGNYGYYNTSGTYVGQFSIYENKGTQTSPSFELVTRDYAGVSAYNLKGIYPTFGDLDGDGDEDMIVGTFDGVMHYFDNIAGSGNPPNFILTFPNYKAIAGDFATPQLIDVNRDGKLDLLVGERDGRLNYMENVGTVNAPSFNAAPTNDFFGGIDMMLNCCTGFSSPFLTEDSSGSYVLYVGSEEGHLVQFDNIEGNLTGNFNLVDSFYLDGLNNSISGADINNDGHFELIYGELSGGIRILKQGITIGIDKIAIKETHVLVYPNPSNGLITLELLSSFLLNEAVAVEVFDIVGKKLLSIPIDFQNKININLRNTTPGVYFCRIIIADGSFITKKIIVR
jgi:hypothetical protein